MNKKIKQAYVNKVLSCIDSLNDKLTLLEKKSIAIGAYYQYRKQLKAHE